MLPFLTRLAGASQVLESAGHLPEALALLSDGQHFSDATELIKRHPLQEGSDFTPQKIDEFAKQVGQNQIGPKK